MVKDTMLEIFVKGPWHSTFITAKYEYSTQTFFVKSKICRKVRTSHLCRCYIFNELANFLVGTRDQLPNRYCNIEYK